MLINNVKRLSKQHTYNVLAHTYLIHKLRYPSKIIRKRKKCDFSPTHLSNVERRIQNFFIGQNILFDLIQGQHVLKRFLNLLI